MSEIKVEVHLEPRPNGTKPFGSLFVNDRHIWRFDAVNSAELAARNLRQALGVAEPGAAPTVTVAQALAPAPAVEFIDPRRDALDDDIELFGF